MEHFLLFSMISINTVDSEAAWKIFADPDQMALSEASCSGSILTVFSSPEPKAQD